MQSFSGFGCRACVQMDPDMQAVLRESGEDWQQRCQAMPSPATLSRPAGTVARWHALASRETAPPKLWMDAYLAGFAIAGGLGLLTLDCDFKQFAAMGLDATVRARVQPARATCSHAAPILPAHLKKGVGDLAQAAAAHGLHQQLEHVLVVDHRLLQALEHGG